MGELVKEAIELFDKLTNHELMIKYSKNRLSSFPSTVETKALLTILEKRSLSYLSSETTISFLNLKTQKRERVILTGGIQ